MLGLGFGNGLEFMPELGLGSKLRLGFSPCPWFMAVSGLTPGLGFMYVYGLMTGLGFMAWVRVYELVRAYAGRVYSATIRGWGMAMFNIGLWPMRGLGLMLGSGVSHD